MSNHNTIEVMNQSINKVHRRQNVIMGRDPNSNTITKLYLFFRHLSAFPRHRAGSIIVDFTVQFIVEKRVSRPTAPGEDPPPVPSVGGTGSGLKGGFLNVDEVMQTLKSGIQKSVNGSLFSTADANSLVIRKTAKRKKDD